jgi:error-prone DNA polymerase
MSYTELQVTTNFSFLRGASHPHELVEYAAKLGYTAIAVTDRNSVAGIVRAHVAAKEKGIRLIVGCRLDITDGPSLLAYPINAKGYANLTNLLTTGNLRAEKGSCALKKADVYQHASDLKFVAIPPAVLNRSFDFDRSFKESLKEYKHHLGNHLYLAAQFSYNGHDGKILYRLSRMAAAYETPLVAVNDVLYHHPSRSELQDIVTCIREKCTIANAGYRLQKNTERYLKPEREIRRLFARYPGVVDRTQEIVDACTFSLEELKYQYPDEVVTPGRTGQEDLTILTWEGANRRYKNSIPEEVRKQVEYELAFIEKKNYAKYFLTVYDMVRYCQQEKILCQGRGSAANSAVCYCLGITSVDPTKFKLLFERFLSEDRNEPPDIDLDMENKHRERVFQYIYNKYGRKRAAIVATVIRMQEKGAVRDVGRVMGLSVDTIDRLSGVVSYFSEEGFSPHRIAEQGLNPEDKHLQKVLELTTQYIGTPRQLGQHTGGFVITNDQLSNLVPIMNASMANRTCIEWDKDDIDAMGFMKVDGLALGMMTCLHKAFDLIKLHYGLDLSLADVPLDDPEVYAMLCRGDSIGVFQVESSAQQSMLPRLRPVCFYDLVIQVAIVRPGPIIGNMVHPFLRRRNGQEPVHYPSKAVEEILGRTLGVPLFQEQAMELAIKLGNFSGSDADKLRKSMATFKMKLGVVNQFEEKLIKGMLENGYSIEYAHHLFDQLRGFGSYGFPESHAASFALLVYVSAWIKCKYPDVFACALLNSMPMGFWQVAQILICALKHGVIGRPIDINHSYWENTLEEKVGQYRALRLGFLQIKGIREDQIRLLLSKRHRPFRTIDEVRNTGISEATLQRLADADVFRSMGLDRRQALWEVVKTDTLKGIFEGQPSEMPAEMVDLPVMSDAEHVVHDYGITALSLKGHPVSFMRPALQKMGVVTAADITNIPDGRHVKVAGLVLIRQRPGTAKGVCFISLEDETAQVRLVIFPNVFDRDRREILESSLLMAEGRLQKEGDVIHVIVTRCKDFSQEIKTLYAELPEIDESTLLPASHPNDTPSLPEKFIPTARNFK